MATKVTRLDVRADEPLDQHVQRYAKKHTITKSEATRRLVVLGIVFDTVQEQAANGQLPSLA